MYLAVKFLPEGLFRGAIHHSATALTSYGYQRYARSIAYKTAAAVDSSFTTNNSSRELLQLLQKVPARKLQKIAESLPAASKHINPGYKFAPVVEKGDDAFITDLTYEKLKKGNFNKVKVIVGMNSEESLKEAADLAALKKLMASYDQDLTLIVNDDFHITNKSLQLELGKKIRRIYTEDCFQNDLGASIRFLTDSRYSTGIIKYAQMMSKFVDVYYYQFSYDGELGNVDVSLKGADNVAHSEELQYLWSNSRNENIKKFPEADICTHERLVNLWTNFVNDLNPTFEKDELFENITWPTVKPDKFCYLDIREHLQVKKNPKGNTFKFWDNIYQTYAVPPLDTY